MATLRASKNKSSVDLENTEIAISIDISNEKADYEIFMPQVPGVDKLPDQALALLGAMARIKSDKNFAKEQVKWAEEYFSA